MDEEKGDYRRKLASAEQDKVKLEKDAKKLKAEHKEKIAGLVEKLKSAEDESQIIILDLNKEKHKLELQVGNAHDYDNERDGTVEAAKRELAEFEAEFIIILANKELELDRLKAAAEKKE